jgi:hypothetical protein
MRLSEATSDQPRRVNNVILNDQPTGLKSAPQLISWRGGNRTMGISRRQLILVGGGAVAVASKPAWPQGPLPLNGGATSGSTFGQIPIGGGGYVTGMDLAADGTIVGRVDVFGAYLNNTSNIDNTSNVGNWAPLITATSVPSSLFGFANGDSGGTYVDFAGHGGGVYEIRIAPSNTNVMYMLWGAGPTGVMLVTTNKGATWTQMSNFPLLTFFNRGYQNDANSGLSRLFQKKIAVDPKNENIVYIGTPANGLYVTTNGTNGASATFTQITGVPAGTSRNGVCAVAFDPTSSIVGRTTQHIIACSYGNGVYETTNGGSSWALAGSGGPTECCDGIFSGGVYYAATGHAGTGVQIYANSGSAGNGKWYDGGGNALTAIAINPFDLTWICGWGNGGGNLHQGVISGTSISWQGPYWYSGGNPNVPPSDAGWIANTMPGYPSSFPPSNYWAGGGIFFDPTIDKLPEARIWMSWGYGMSYLDMPSKTEAWDSKLALNNRVVGIENMVATQIASAPGYDVVVGVEDNQIFRIVSLSAPPSSSISQLGNRNYNCTTWSMDWSQSVQGLIVALSSGYYIRNTNYTSYSMNGGATWTAFSPTPFSVDGGDITCARSGQFCALTVGTAAPVYWTGSAWATSSGAPSVGYITSKWNNTKVLANDAAGSMYLTGPSVGLYKSTNGGQTWSKIDGTVLTTSTYISALKAVPGKAQYLFYSNGYHESGPYPTRQAFYRRTSDSGPWAAVRNVNDVFCFGFGAVYPGYTYPTLWLLGFVNKGGAGYRWGLWRSRDLGVSDWTWITNWPWGNVDAPRCMSGDMNDHMKVYIGYMGTSFVYGSGLV